MKKNSDFDISNNFNDKQSTSSNDIVDSFYLSYESQIDSIIDEYVNDIFKLNSESKTIKLNDAFKISDLNDGDNKINECKKIIKKNKKNYNIISFFCFFIIGFLFFKKRKNAKKIINENLCLIKEIEEEKNKYISVNDDLKSNNKKNEYSNFLLKDFYKYFFNKLGINIDINYYSDNLYQLINSNSLVDIYSTISGKYNNTYFWDIFYREITFKKNKVFFNKEFEYVDKKDNKNKFEKLTFEHFENIPIFENKNILISKINYFSDYKIWNNSNKSIYKDSTSNDFFINMGISSDKSNNDQMNNIFNITTQKNFLKWQSVNKKINNFTYWGNELKINPDKNDLTQIDDIKKIDNTIDNFDFSNRSTHFIKQKLKSIARSYFEKWLKMMQTSLLFNINDENENNFNYDKIKISSIAIANKFLDKKYCSILDENINQIDLIWFEHERTTIDNNNNYISKYIFNTFNKIDLTKEIEVEGKFVGKQFFNIPYFEYKQIKQEKLMMYFLFNSKIEMDFIINKNLDDLINETNYDDSEFFHQIKQLHIWTNKPKNFYDLKNNDIIISFSKIFNIFNDRYELNATLRIDANGVYIFINNNTYINESIIHQLSLQLKKIISLIDKLI